MEGYSNSYQNSASARETEFQRLAQNIGTNIQKIQQNGKFSKKKSILIIIKNLFSSFVNAANDYSDRESPGQHSTAEPIVRTN